ncbi:MAG: hypothetical protein AMJ77_06650 [Dehalococcoidia bacterium SM23_28_2]|nr:MAG: hypothetical protein AMJ77_06650 [Dehalococcoidia bacterium SM23_28_2]
MLRRRGRPTSRTAPVQGGQLRPSHRQLAPQARRHPLPAAKHLPRADQRLHTAAPGSGSPKRRGSQDSPSPALRRRPTG